MRTTGRDLARAEQIARWLYSPRGVNLIGAPPEQETPWSAIEDVELCDLVVKLTCAGETDDLHVGRGLVNADTLPELIDEIQAK